MGEDELLTIPEVAKMAGVRPITIRRHIQAGHIAYEKPGRDYLIRRSEAERFRDTPRLPGRPPKSPSS